MGGVISSVELILTAGLVGMGATEIVLRAKLKEIIQPHQEEFILMEELYQFVDVLLSQKNLVSQLNGNVLFATDNWNTIFYDLEAKNDQLKKIFERFPEVKSSNFSYSFTNGLMFGASVMAMGYMLYNVVSGKTKTQILADATAFRNFFKASASKLRALAPIIRSGSINAEGVIEVISHGSNNELVPPETRSSKTEKVKAQEKQGLKSKAITGLRLIFMALAIFQFVQGVKNLIYLNEQIAKYEEYFKDEGEFQQSKYGVIELMNFVAADIFNLGNASRAAFYDSRITLLLMSILYPRHHDRFIDYSKRLDNQKFGMGDDFIDESKRLIDSCNGVVTSNTTSTHKLKDLENYFRKFFDTMNPEKVFLDVSIELSKVTGEFSVVSNSVQEDQSRGMRLLRGVSQDIIDFRGTYFDLRPPERKKQIDTIVVDSSWSRLKTIYGLNPNIPIQQAGDIQLDILFQVLISFADSFYFDDATGETLFKRNILKEKQKSNYQNMLEETLSGQNVIPVRRSKDTDEEAEIKYWLELAKAQNAKENYAYWASNIKPVSHYRYLRLEVGSFKNTEGKEIGTLLSYEGIHFNASISIATPQLFNYERNVMTGQGILKKA